MHTFVLVGIYSVLLCENLQCRYMCNTYMYVYVQEEGTVVNSICISL